MNVRPFLRRGAINTIDLPPAGKASRYVCGTDSTGHWACASKHNRKQNNATSPFFSKDLLVKGRHPTAIKNWVPFSSLFDKERLHHFKLATFSEGQSSDDKAMGSLVANGFKHHDIVNPHPLDEAVAFSGDTMYRPRLSRYIPMQVQAKEQSPPAPNSCVYTWFALPAFAMTSTTWDPSIWEAAREFQASNPTTYITRIQVVYAILVWLWISKNVEKDHQVPMEVFVAYFPTYMKFHEVRRLGAYTEPFELVRSLYHRDLDGNNCFMVRVDNGWTKKVESALQNITEGGPFAFLTPAMIEGSALGGPFLEFESYTLSEIHHLSGLGSIWTIGLPDSGVNMSSSYALYGYPRHWDIELIGDIEPIANVEFTPDSPYLTLQAIQPSWKDALGSENLQILSTAEGLRAVHIGAKMGVKKIAENPGWTAHLPSVGGTLCMCCNLHNLSDFNANPNTIVTAKLKMGNENFARLFEKLTESGHRQSAHATVSVGSPLKLTEVPEEQSIKWPTMAVSRTLVPAGTSLSHKPPGPPNPPVPEKGPPALASSKAIAKENKSLKARIQELERQLKSKKTVQSDTSASSKEMMQKIRKHEGRIAELEAEKEGQLQEIAELSRQIKEPLDPLHSGPQGMPTDIELALREARENITQLKNELRLSQVKLKSAEFKMQLAQIHMTEPGEQVPEGSATESGVQRLREEKVVLEKEIAKLKADANELREKLAYPEDHLKTYRELQQAQFEVMELSKRLSLRINELSELEEQLQIYKDAYGEDVETEARPARSETRVQLSTLAPGALKRAAQEAVYGDEAQPHGKRLKLSQEINLASYVSPATGDFYRHAHNTVLRVAGMGGLINPMHFKVSEQGIVSFTDLGRQRAEMQGQTVVPYEDWKSDMQSNMTKMIRAVISEAGFFSHGHASMLRLIRLLKSPDVVPISNLIDALSFIEEETEGLRGTLLETMEQVKKGAHSLFLRDIDTVPVEAQRQALVGVLKDLYGLYEDRSLPPDLVLKTTFFSDTTALLDAAGVIYNYYKDVSMTFNIIQKESKIPDVYLSPLQHHPPA
ncbi:hypothetical protein CONLIGDRAFT_715304 [Coniochaeta ligniaria NRRL 30616]|uniref:Uncharacterized protein n=1 Tax=Coniochaeta ligniaria NRRL 30616 TaxID=1408157 RepID=A0A1J7J6D9_9PEZI|nr:hypothetical protein CONLIGDRAFT_715304 [Coniochaeta ligniaria NRRL 30616]